MALFGNLLGGKGGKKKKRSKKAETSKKKTTTKPPVKPKVKTETTPVKPADMDIDLSEIEEQFTKSVKPAIPRKKAYKAGSSSETKVISPHKRQTKDTAKTDKKDNLIKKADGSISTRRKRTSIAKKRLGNLLVGAQVISEEQLEKALKTQKESGGLLGQILEKMGVCNASNVSAALNKQRTITTVELDNVSFDPEAIKMVTKTQCEKYRLIPFQKIGSLLCVAMSNVLDSTAKNELKDTAQTKLKTFDSGWAEIAEAIKNNYPDPDEVEAREKTDAAVGQDEIEISQLQPENEETVDQVIEPEEPDDLIELDDEELDDLIIELPDEEITEPPEKPEAKTKTAPVITAPATTKETPVADKLVAIPVSDDYFNRVISNGIFRIEKRWLLERSETAALPVELLQ